MRDNLSFNIVFKFFAISFSGLLFIYTIILFQQSKNLVRTLSTGLDKFIIYISLIQIGMALFLVFLSINL